LFFTIFLNIPATAFGGFIITIFILFSPGSKQIYYAYKQNYDGQRYYHNVIRQKERQKNAETEADRRARDNACSVFTPFHTVSFNGFIIFYARRFRFATEM
jgi:hypothetical protein